MKKFITALGFCLIATTANATEFSCTMSKLSYISALDPLVPMLKQKFAEADYAAIEKAEQSLNYFMLTVFFECDDITTKEQLDEVIEALAVGTIGFNTSSEK